MKLQVADASVSVHTALDRDVKHAVERLAKKHKVPQCALINTFCHDALVKAKALKLRKRKK